MNRVKGTTCTICKQYRQEYNSLTLKCPVHRVPINQGMHPYLVVCRKCGDTLRSQSKEDSLCVNCI